MPVESKCLLVKEINKNLFDKKSQMYHSLIMKAFVCYENY
jgi:hypothetical protein